MTPDRLIEIAMSMHWHRKEGWLLAPALGLQSDRLVVRWITGRREIPDYVAAWLEELKATLDRAPKDQADCWQDSSMTKERLDDILDGLAWNPGHLATTLSYDPTDQQGLWRDVTRPWAQGTLAIPAAVAAWLEEMNALMERAPDVATITAREKDGPDARLESEM